jgi:hypothetical protein
MGSLWHSQLPALVRNHPAAISIEIWMLLYMYHHIIDEQCMLMQVQWSKEAHISLPDLSVISINIPSPLASRSSVDNLLLPTIDDAMEGLMG